MLIESLVNCANKGEFPSVPSIWDSFIRLAAAEAQINTIAYIGKPLYNILY
jgi:hypothetical protein